MFFLNFQLQISLVWQKILETVDSQEILRTWKNSLAVIAKFVWGFLKNDV